MTREALKSIAGTDEDTEMLLLDILRVHLPDLHEVFNTATTIAENIHSVFQIYNKEIKETKIGSAIAAEATKGMKVKRAKER